MSKCDVCGKEIDVEWDVGFIWIGCDGDVVCSNVCKEKYEKDRDYFFDVVLKDAGLFERWMMSEI